MRARDLMTAMPKVVTIHETTPHAARLMAQFDIGMLPVVDSFSHRHLLGVITDRDLVVRCLAQGHLIGCRVEDHLTRDPLITVTPDADLDTIVTLMERHHVRRLPVVQGIAQEVIGVITLGDLVRLAGPSHPGLIENLEERIHARGALTH